MFDFEWNKSGDGWVLTPLSGALANLALISVQPRDWYWQILVGNCPLNARYTGQIGAKTDAWQHALAHRLVYFGSRKIRLLPEQAAHPVAE